MNVSLLHLILLLSSFGPRSYLPNCSKTFGSVRSQSCVEYAEKAALHKHSMWSSLAVDVLLGNLIGFALLFHAESICLWILNFANDATNELLRSGCVWLMGVPAGFKLNTELAGVLGMISLNAIQIWSTLWMFVGSLTIYLVRGLAFLGIVFGMTVPAALVIDMIVLVTLHVSTLHWVISILYSQQIQALAALWRLFRYILMYHVTLLLCCHYFLMIYQILWLSNWCMFALFK